MSSSSNRPVLHICLNFTVCIFFSELCWGKAMVAYAKPQHLKNGESERLRGERERERERERDQIKFLGFERWQVARFRKARRHGVP